MDNMCIYKPTIHHNLYKMNFTILFGIVSTLSFSVRFNLDEGKRQDFFLFEGNNQSAHLFRIDYKLHLNLMENGKHKFLTSNLDGYNFSFTWKGYKVNGKDMVPYKSNKNTQIWNSTYNTFTFISPLITDWEQLECPPEPVYSCEKKTSINYGYVVMIGVGLLILCQSKELVNKAYALFTKTQDTLAAIEEIDDCLKE